MRTGHLEPTYLGTFPSIEHANFCLVVRPRANMAEPGHTKTNCRYQPACRRRCSCYIRPAISKRILWESPICRSGLSGPRPPITLPKEPATSGKHITTQQYRSQFQVSISPSLWGPVRLPRSWGSQRAMQATGGHVVSQPRPAHKSDVSTP